MEYRCDKCDKKYSSYQSLWIHNKKFHNNDVVLGGDNVVPCGDNVVQQNKTNQLLQCIYCKRYFNDRSNKWKHEQKCKEKITIQEKNNKLETENKKLKNELQTIKTNIQTTNNNNNIQNTTNNTNTNSHNNINNGTINNNYVVINKFGTEKIADVPINDIRSIINSDINSVITCTKKVNFNRKLPQYHSFCATTLEGDHFTKINHKTQKPEKINKKDFINEVLNSSIKFLNDISVMIEFDEEFRNKISLEEQEKIKNIIKYQDRFHEVKNKKAFFQSINDISYNCKDLILKTWETVQPVNDFNFDSDDDNYSEPDLDPNFRGYETSDSE